MRAIAQLETLSPLRTCLLLTLLALAVRLTVMAFLYGQVLEPGRDHWSFGYEEGREARAIAEGKGFSNPLNADTGPTAWHPPIYPYLLAGIFRLFGIYTQAAAFAAVTVNCFLAALTCIPMYYFALRSFGRATAVVAGAMWIIFPYSVYLSVARVWDTWLGTLLLSILFLAVLRMESSNRTYQWAGLGLLVGFMALTNPTTVTVTPGLGLWLIRSVRKAGKRWLLPAGAALFCTCAVVAPWMLRNYMVFHRFIPIRDDLGLEFGVGNDGNYAREYDLYYGPWIDEAGRHNPEWERFQAMGEIAYFDEKERQAWNYIRRHPGEYLAVTGRRIVNVWTDFWSIAPDYLSREPLSPLEWTLCTILSGFTLHGLALAWKADSWSAWPYAAVLLFYPIIFYLTHTAEWYRRPIDPFFVVLTAYAWVTLYRKRWGEEGRTARGWRRLVAGLGLNPGSVMTENQQGEG